MISDKFATVEKVSTKIEQNRYLTNNVAFRDFFYSIPLRLC